MQIDKITLIVISSILTWGSEILTMSDCIALMKENNPHIRISHENQLLAQRAQSIHEKRFLPTLNPLTLKYDATDNQGYLEASSQWKTPLGSTINLSYQTSIQKESTYQLSLEQPITHNIEHAKDSIKSFDIEINILKEKQHYETLILKMRKLYYNCVIDQLTIEHQKSKLADIHHALQRHEILYKNGEISKLEMDKLFNQHEKISIDFLKREQASELRQLELKQMLGLPLYQQINLDSSIQHNMSEISPIEAISKALSENNMYLIAKLQFEKVKHKYEIEKKMDLPKVSVYAKTNEKKNFNAGIKVQLLMPNAEADYHATIIDVNYHHQRQQFLDSDLALRTKVHELLLSLYNQDKIISLSAKNLQLQQSIYHAESIQFKHQQISLEDFQKASDQLQQAYHASLNAQIEYSHLRDELLQTIGAFSLIVQQESPHA
jgi:outer membrane protein TolC